MTREKSLQMIRSAFSHVDVDRIVVEYDTVVEEPVARVYVKSDQLDAAFGEDGFYPRRVAMKAGLAIEIVLAGS
jgi:transcription antitermination factor NusA-like protein